MAFNGKHEFGELEGKRITFVEKGATENRVNFLKKLLEHNGFSVVILKEESEGEPVKYSIGVEDLIFNPTIWVYERRLKTLDGRIVSPAYWEQKTEKTKPQYWDVKPDNTN